MRRFAAVGVALFALILTGCPSLPPPDRLEFDTDPRILRGSYLGSVDTRVVPSRMALAGDASLLAVSWSERIELWDVASGGVLADVPLPTDGFTGLSDLGVDGSGSVVAGALNGQAILWDGRDGTPIGEFDPAGRLGECLYCGVHELAVHPGGQMFAAAGQSPVVLLVDVPSTSVVHELETAGHVVGMVAFSADGRRLAAGSLLSESRYALRVWDTANQEVVFDREGVIDPGRVPRFAFSADGSSLAVGSADKVEIFDLAGGVAVLDLDGWGESWLRSLSPDGARVMLDRPAEHGTVLAVVDVATGEDVALFSDVLGGDASWSDDGRYLIAGSVLVEADSFGRVRDFARGQLHSLELGSVAEFVTSQSYAVFGTLSIDGGPDLAFDGVVEGNESQRYLRPQARAPHPATLEIELHEHPWRLHAWQVREGYFTLEPLQPGDWSGNVTDVSGGDDQAWYPLRLWRARPEADAGRPIPVASRPGP